MVIAGWIHTSKHDGEYPIGVSRASCWLCHEALHALNLFNRQTKLVFYYRKRHFRIFPDWAFPDFLPPNVISRVETLLAAYVDAHAMAGTKQSRFFSGSTAGSEDADEDEDDETAISVLDDEASYNASKCLRFIETCHTFCFSLLIDIRENIAS